LKRWASWLARAITFLARSVNLSNIRSLLPSSPGDSGGFDTWPGALSLRAAAPALTPSLLWRHCQYIVVNARRSFKPRMFIATFAGTSARTIIGEWRRVLK